ncbi:MAG TPA: hypothetical protein PKM59_15135, partial [Thermodesulfobacteriota bacterium]|nr:hypothetical protein [Thermodesulfobacteriota bacterium]
DQPRSRSYSHDGWSSFPMVSANRGIWRVTAARPNRPFGDVAAKGSNEAVSGRSDPAQLHAFWGIDVTCGELSPFRKTQAQAVGRVKKKTQLPRASRSVIINSAFSVRSGHFLCKN